MKITQLALITLAAVAANLAVAQSQPELLVSKEGSAYTIDFVNDSGEPVTATMFSIKIGELTQDKVDLSNCTSGLPRTHVGFCQFNPGVVKVVIYSGSNAELPSAGNIGIIGIAAPERRELSRAALRAEPGIANKMQVEFTDAVFTRVDGRDIEGVILQ